MDDFLPTDLCKICHINPTKYRCPRCSTRTCSLPCTQRHKQWAQCTGIRDPAAYIKRADLATPRAIDHDYNFLTGIERTLDRAERDVAERGMVLRDEDGHGWRGKGPKTGPAKGEVQAKAAMNECGVVVRKAPEGMTRAKQNKTGWSKKKRTLIWTIEWIHNNGHSSLGTCPATTPLADAYKSHTSPTPSTATKRKRSPSTPPNPPSPSPQPANQPPLHFYLLRPLTRTGTRVLVPLDPGDTLAQTALRDRVVLEFPTVYVLRYGPADLPTGFVAEERI